MTDPAQEKTKQSPRISHRIHTMNNLWKTKIGSSTEKAILAYLILHSAPNQVPLQCFPSIKTMATHLELSPRQVQTKLRLLEKKGYIEIRERRRPPRQTSNLYIINSFMFSRLHDTKLDEAPAN